MSIEADAKAISDATTGPHTPNRVRIVRPTTLAEWCQVGALALSGALASTVIAVLTFRPWPASASPQLIHYLGWILSVVGVVATALAMSFVKVEATAGSNSLHLDGRQNEG